MSVVFVVIIVVVGFVHIHLKCMKLGQRTKRVASASQPATQQEVKQQQQQSQIRKTKQAKQLLTFNDNTWKGYI